MSGLCKYKNSLGIPNQGIHSYRFLGVAIVDVLFVVLFAVALKFLLNKSYSFMFMVMGITFVLGIVLHRLFCVNTTVNKLLFGVV